MVEEERLQVILLMTTVPPLKSPWGVPARLPPLGLAYVAAALEKAGFEVNMLDNYQLNKPMDFVKQEIERLKPEIIGITCSSVTYERCIEMAKVARELLPTCKVVVGGWHPSYLPDTMLQHPEIDYVVMGEGEEAMVKEPLPRSQVSPLSIKVRPSKTSRRLLKTWIKFHSRLDICCR